MDISVTAEPNAPDTEEPTYHVMQTVPSSRYREAVTAMNVSQSDDLGVLAGGDGDPYNPVQYPLISCPPIQSAIGALEVTNGHYESDPYQPLIRVDTSVVTPLLMPVVTPIVTPLVTDIVMPLVTPLVTDVVMPLVTPLVTDVVMPLVTPLVTDVVMPVVKPSSGNLTRRRASVSIADCTSSLREAPRSVKSGRRRSRRSKVATVTARQMRKCHPRLSRTYVVCADDIFRMIRINKV